MDDKCEVLNSIVCRASCYLWFKSRWGQFGFSIYLSIYPPHFYVPNLFYHPFLQPSTYPSTHPINPSNSPLYQPHPSICPSSQSIHTSMHPLMHQSTHTFHRPKLPIHQLQIYPSSHPCNHISIHPPIHLSSPSNHSLGTHLTHQSIHPSIYSSHSPVQPVIALPTQPAIPLPTPFIHLFIISFISVIFILITGPVLMTGEKSPRSSSVNKFWQNNFWVLYVFNNQ